MAKQTDEAGASIGILLTEKQISALKEYCRKRGWTPTYYICDKLRKAVHDMDAEMAETGKFTLEMRPMYHTQYHTVKNTNGEYKVVLVNLKGEEGKRIRKYAEMTGLSLRILAKSIVVKYLEEVEKELEWEEMT